MPLDLARLRSLQSRRDAERGLEERFLQPTIGGAPTVAVLAMPLEGPGDIGWVVCHSLGLEQIWLGDLEVATARALAAAGQPVLRFHGQGYGDSAGESADIRVATHRRDAVDAVAVLRAETGVARVGLLAPRFGAAIALSVAPEVSAHALALWDPMTDGQTYVRSLIRTAAVTKLATEGTARTSAIEALDEQDELDVSGAPLSKSLLDDVAAFAPFETWQSGMRVSRALVVQVSKAVDPRGPTIAVVERLREAGCDATLEVVADPGARTWGSQRYLSTENSRTKADTQTTLVAELIRRTVDWAARSGRAVDGSRI